MSIIIYAYYNMLTACYTELFLLLKVQFSGKTLCLHGSALL